MPKRETVQRVSPPEESHACAALQYLMTLYWRLPEKRRVVPMRSCKGAFTNKKGAVAAAESALETTVTKHLQRASGTSRARMGGGVKHPVPVDIFYWPEGRFETVLAVNYAAGQELVREINAEKGTRRCAYIR